MCVLRVAWLNTTFVAIHLERINIIAIYLPGSNWLPSLAGKAFSLTLRTYVPKDTVKREG